MRVSTKATLLATALALAWACATPTDVCGCPPSRSWVVVTGTIRNALGAPLASTFFTLEATAEAFPNGPVASTDVRTDAAGAFAAPLYSGYPPGLHTITARIIRNADHDTVRVRIGRAAFKLDRQSPDTLRFAVQLP